MKTLKTTEEPDKIHRDHKLLNKYTDSKNH